ncbi:MAG: D-alanyl-D-alanine carboxypeptidase family protein [Spirochaetaceae bacterium]|nr:MAG: D-alanyl-D-alanine carboxypeptidase family protein [Spirochaetaceae bacterium]
MKPIRVFAVIIVVLAAAVGGALGVSTALSMAAPDAAQPSVKSEAEPEAAQLLHPEFDLSMNELRNLVSAAPVEAQEAVLARPQYFLELMKKAMKLPADYLVLVDKQNRLPSDYVPHDLVRLNEYSDRILLNRSDLSLRRALMPDLLAMIEAAEQDGISLLVSSTYRSYDYQAGLFQRNVERFGEERARTFSAEPGASQHQLGTAIDFGDITPAFAETAAGRWVRDHAHIFGFSLSYPQGFEELTGYIWEPWHYRWITRLGSEIEQEFFGGIQQHFLEFFDAAEPQLRSALESGSRE